MDTEAAQIIAERNLRQQHKFLQHWGKADQRDENAWTRHDNEKHGMPYAICTVCEYLEGKRNAW